MARGRTRRLSRVVGDVDMVWEVRVMGLGRQRFGELRGRRAVRNLPLAAVVSAVVHAAVVAWLAMRAPAPRHAAAAPTVTPIEIVRVDRALPAEALDVALVDEPAIAPPPSARGTPRAPVPTSPLTPARTAPSNDQA